MFGIGVDLVKISRLENLSEHQKIRMFSPLELKEAEALPPLKQSEYFASRFAAKEAFSKAMGIGLVGFSLAEVAVIKSKSGVPSFIFCGKAKELVGSKTFMLSLSHEKEYTIAMVVCNEE